MTGENAKKKKNSPKKKIDRRIGGKEHSRKMLRENIFLMRF
jgi:hypothetical protein